MSKNYPHERRVRPLADRFWAKVQKSDGCWIWTGHRNHDGYGRILTGTRAAKHKALTHRISWMLFFGDIPDGLLVCHRCDNPPCVRPDHLFLGTDQDNASDKMAKGRLDDRRGEANGRAKLTRADVEWIRANATAESAATMAARFGVTEGAIYHARRGFTWGDA